MPPCAFAVGGESLAGAVFRREGGGLRLVERHALPLPAGTLGDGPLGAPLGDAEALSAVVGELVGRFARRPRQASLVLPDAWARGLVVELGALPERGEARAEVLRFRLRKLVPFRPEELRVAAAPIAAVAGQEDPLRVLTLFAAEPLCAAFESSFAAAGVRLGQIVDTSLALVSALAHGGRLAGVVALATVEARSFTLVCARDGEPVLWRQKSFGDSSEAETRAPRLAAELKLTRTFLAERLDAPRLDAVLLAAPDDVRAVWSEVLAEGLGRPPAIVAADSLPLAAESAREADAALAPLVGAACREVA
ncbi:MAG TPA: hypothetical protein VGC00_03835 [Thermoanaerobaculia bacterium]